MAHKFYITTSIAYVNAPPHLGFALESVQADVLARYHRQRGEDVFFLTGTDEHGAKVVKAAEVAGLDAKKFVDKNAELFRNLKSVLNLSWDNFIRTSDQKVHWPVARKIWQSLAKSGDIYKKKYQGLYCVGHEAFITEKDLADGKCRDHQAKPEVVEEENYFFRLSKYIQDIEGRIKKNELRILPEGRKNEALGLIKEGVEDVSFSRPRKDLSWGIPVPGDDEHTMYVWCDALTNYISGAPGRWPADAHLIGKDILRFHALLWPGMLLSAGLPLFKEILVHGHITVDGQKMSKTIGNVIDPVELVKKYGSTSSPQAGADAVKKYGSTSSPQAGADAVKKYGSTSSPQAGVDSVRYYLLREISSAEDGDFSYEKFEERYNGDLANGLGNFAARVLTLGEKLGEIKTYDADEIIAKKIEAARKTVEEKVNEFKLHEALAAIWELLSFGDAYVNDHKPWSEEQSAKHRQETIFNAIVILDNVAALLLPFLPGTSEKITQCIKWVNKNTLRAKKPETLFPRL